MKMQKVSIHSPVYLIAIRASIKKTKQQDN